MVKFILSYTFILSTALFAQDFIASVRETTVADNERFEVSFTFSGKYPCSLLLHLELVT